MGLFDYPSHDRYRTLRDVTPALPPMIGPDVYGLQCALNEVLSLSYNGDAINTDGSLGPKTGKEVWKAQAYLEVVEDGLAGQETQRALCLYLIANRLTPWSTRYILVMGIIAKESSFWLGNYSAQRDDGNYDAGVTQQNTEHNDPAEAFNPVQAVAKLTAYAIEGLGLYNDRALYVGDDHSRRRRLSLAAGRWNAPAWSNFLAGVRPWAVPTAEQRDTLEAYMAACTVMLDER